MNVQVKVEAGRFTPEQERALCLVALQMLARWRAKPGAFKILGVDVVISE